MLGYHFKTSLKFKIFSKKHLVFLVKICNHCQLVFFTEDLSKKIKYYLKIYIKSFCKNRQYYKKKASKNRHSSMIPCCFGGLLHTVSSRFKWYLAEQVLQILGAWLESFLWLNCKHLKYFLGCGMYGKT